MNDVILFYLKIQQAFVDMKYKNIEAVSFYPSAFLWHTVIISKIDTLIGSLPV